MTTIMKSAFQQQTEDSLSFFNQQMLEEQTLNNNVKLNADIKENLLGRHNIRDIASFLETNSKAIEQFPLLFILPATEQLLPGATITFPWCSTDKLVYSLDAYNYCLCSRAEYASACHYGVSQHDFHDISTPEEKKSKKSSMSPPPSYFSFCLMLLLTTDVGSRRRVSHTETGSNGELIDVLSTDDTERMCPISFFFLSFFCVVLTSL